MEHSGTGVAGSTPFSGDGRHFGYVAAPATNKFVAVVDGKQFGTTYDHIEGPWLFLSQDGGHVADSAKRGDHVFIVVHGVDGPNYDGIHDFAFSPDGHHYAFAARANGKCFVVREGVEEAGYTWAGKQTVAEGLDTRLIDIGIAGGNFDPGSARVSRGRLAYSADGKRLAYGVFDEGKWRIAVDHRVIGLRFDDVGNPVFSPDGKHVAFMALRQGRWHLMLDERENGPDYDAYPSNAEVVFDGNTSLHTLGKRKTQFYILTVSGFL